MDVAISGSHGLIGTALARSLRDDGHTVRALGRRDIAPAALDGADAVVNLAGAPIGAPFTAKHKHAVRASRIRTTQAIVAAMRGLDRPPAVLVSGSAVGAYGAHRGDELLTESSPVPEPDFLTELCADWEAEALAATELGVRVALARTGIVLSAAGGALKAQLRPFKLGLGGPIGSGAQWMSWISLSDEAAALRFLLDHDVAGPVNLTAPDPVRNRDFTKALGAALHRPAKLRIPGIVRRVPGPVGEMVDLMLFASQRVLPVALTDAGFTFTHPDLDGALQAALGS